DPGYRTSHLPILHISQLPPETPQNRVPTVRCAVDACPSRLLATVASPSIAPHPSDYRGHDIPPGVSSSPDQSLGHRSRFFSRTILCHFELFLSNLCFLR